MLICINCSCEFDYDSAEKRIIQEYDFAFKCTYPSEVHCCPECGSIEWVDTEDKED